MAIFVALIFQVLFVFFAMAINIGLVVHDKINLQNAVDLAAYYAAQRQAEMLNAIAHQNYQIRQSYKLLAWRYRVLGTAGRTDHPSQRPRVSGEGLYPAQENPIACIAYRPLFEDAGSSQGQRSGGDNLCKGDFGGSPSLQAPEIPNVILPFDFISQIFRRAAQQTVDFVARSCRQYGGYNWWYASMAMTAFTLDQANRKQVIYALADNLSRDFTEMVDMNGDTVFEGAAQTFRKNLTYENADNIVGFRMHNSIQGLSREQWLNEKAVMLTKQYMDVVFRNNACQMAPRQVTTLPQERQGMELLQSYTGMNEQQLLSLVLPRPPGSIEQHSLGVEKNPWQVLYVGVTAETEPRQLFFPFGPRVQFRATGYAMPFGGRIGPWYYSSWPQGSITSSGGEKVDMHAPPLVQEGGGVAPNELTSMLPNYSRFPGDPLGLKSTLAANALNQQYAQMESRLEYNKEIFLFDPGSAGDPLSWDENDQQGGILRQYEIAAIAPDLFDATYYSIDPGYGNYFLPRIRQYRQLLGIPDNVPIRGDLGSRMGNRDIVFSVHDQINEAMGQSSSIGPLFRPESYWYIKNPAHLMTSWVHADTMSIDPGIPADRFGVCSVWDIREEQYVKIPGSCIAGGRTGYSVKIVSPSFLRRDDLRFGGQNFQGPILNPPPASF